jgi:hypothetical protein
MADKVYWSVNVEVQNGPKYARTQALDVEAFEKIQVSVPGEDPATAGKPGKASIAVLPTGSLAQFLLITSDKFDPAKLTYKVPGNSPDFVLDGPHMLAGGAIAILGQPKKVDVSNNMGPGQDATITIVVGRDATP